MKDKILLGGAMILLALLFVNAIYSALLNNKIGGWIENAKPAKISIISLKADCTECSDLSSMLTELRKLDVIDDEDVSISSLQGKELVEYYNIQKLPAIIIKGEIEKVPVSGLSKVNDALIMQAGAPYMDASSMRVKGKVNLVLIEDKSCEKCSSVSFVEQNLKRSGIFVSGSKKIDLAEASSLIEKYSIKKVPAVLISEDINEYAVSEDIKKAGLKPTKGYYMIEGTAPYVETATGKVRGLLDMTLISDKSCSECYNLSMHKQMYSQMGLAINNEKSVDIGTAEGAVIKAKYNLTKVPTAILSGDIDAYEGLEELWKQVGGKQFGVLVFREVQLLGDVKYRDLNTGEIIG